MGIIQTLIESDSVWITWLSYHSIKHFHWMKHKICQTSENSSYTKTLQLAQYCRNQIECYDKPVSKAVDSKLDHFELTVLCLGILRNYCQKTVQ